MPLVIHVGIRVDEAPTFTAHLERATGNQVAIETDYDDWNCWGEPYIDQNIMHVRITTVTPMVLLNLLVQRFAGFLVPRAVDGAQLIVTDKDDFELEYVELRYPDVMAMEVTHHGV